MGTRGVVGYKVDGKYYVSYNHSDSYPNGLGDDVVKFVKKVSKENGWEQFKKNGAKVRLVEEDSKPTKKDIEKYSEFHDSSVGSGSPKEWYCLLRNLQGVEYLNQIYKGKVDIMFNGLDFLEDSLFCEYAYIINLDENRLEFYEGFNKNPISVNNPLAELFPIPLKKSAEAKAEPVSFKGSCPLNKVPRNWKLKFYPDKEK